MLRRRTSAVIVVACGGSLRGCSTSSASRWSNGEPGYAWKQRALDESRDIAVEYLTNVSKRTPIHDGVRQKAQQAQRALMGAPAGPLGEHGSSAAEILEEAARLAASSTTPGGGGVGFDWDALFYEAFGYDDDAEGEAEGEGTGDLVRALDNIPASDIKMLTEELFDSASEQSKEHREKVLRAWFHLRAQRAPQTNFTSSMQAGEERNLFTPWYLKNEVK
jgi:hypothetical protein